MSLDLQELFDSAGLDAPPTRVDLEDAVARGRRLRARRRTTVGGALVATAGAVAASVLLVSGLGSSPAAVGDLLVGPALGGGTTSAAPDPAPSSGPGTGEVLPDGEGLTPTQKSRLAAVALPDPAPGFPVRRWPDSSRIGSTEFTRGESASVRTWGLAVTPAKVTTDANGNVGGIPLGPEVTLFVGYFSLPAHGKGLSGQREKLVADVDVAGGRGWVTTGSDKGSPTRNLYVGTGEMSVWISGIDGVTTEQLAALGNALTGLT